MLSRIVLLIIVSIVLCWLPESSCARSGNIWVDYPASNTVINKQSGSFNAGIGFTINGPYTGIIQTGTYCGPGYNNDPQWYGQVEQLDYYNDAYPGSILVNLKYRLDSGASTSFADIRLGDNQDKIAAINIASLTEGTHTATFNAYAIYAERCAYPSSCTTCHGNTYVTGSWVRKEGASFSQTALTFKALSVAGAPTQISPGHRTFVSPSWLGSDHVTFNWSAVSNASSYYLHLTDGEGFSTLLPVNGTSFDTGSDSSIQLQREKKYFWQVAAVNELGTGAWTALRQFIIGTAECWPEIGTGTGQSHIDTCYDLNSNPEIYRLKDISRRAEMNVHGHKGDMGSNKAIITQVGSATAGALVNNTNSWGSQKKAIDAQVNSGKVYDYFLDPLLTPSDTTTTRQFIRNSFDNNGSSMVSIVENPTAQCGVESACFIPIENTVNYDPGSTDSGAIDVVTHEWAHGITATTSLLGDWNEPGALNEAFSDWLSIAHKQARGIASWEIIQGDGSVLRNVADPTRSGQPVIYQKKSSWTNDYKDTLNWGTQGEIHKNAGVPNKMFYLLANGGSHYEVDVQGVGGIERAMKIAYKTNNEGYWASIYSFSDAKTKMLDAAHDLTASPIEINQIKSAWAAVGVGDLPKVTTTSSPNSQAGSTLAYLENAQLQTCAPAHDSCIEAKRYKSTCCSNEVYYAQFGRNVTVEATPKEGYRFVAWTEDGATVSTEPNFTIPSVSTDRALTAIFAPTTPVNLGYTTVNQSSLPIDLTVVNFILPIMTFGQARLTGANATDFAILTNNCNSTTLNQNEGNCVIQVAFTPQASGPRGALLELPASDGQSVPFSFNLTGTGVYTNISLVPSNSSMGMVTLQGNQSWGTTVTALATPNSGYSFTGWQENNVMVSSSASYTFTVTSSRSLIAKFSTSNPAIKVSPQSGEFGLLLPGVSSPPHEFTITNTGTQALSIGTITIDGANGTDFYLNANTCQQPLSASATCKVQAVFAPSGANLRTATMLISSSDTVMPVLALPLTGISGAPVHASGGVGNIGAGYHPTIQEAYNIVGDGSEIKLWAADFNESLTCDRPVTATFRGGYNGNFADKTGKTALQGTMTISKGAVIIDGLQIGGTSYRSDLTTVVDLLGTGTITGSSGNINCSSTCTSSFINGDQVILTASPVGDAVFTGWNGGGCSGTNSCTLNITADTTVTADFSSSKISVAPLTESFGTVYAGNTSSPQTITVTSSGTHNLTIGALSLSGNDATEFTKTGDICSGNPWTPSTLCTIQVSFKPSSTGAKTANLLIPSNDPQTPIFSVSLNGIGKLPAISVTKAGNGIGTVTSSPAGIDCGSVCTADFATNTAVALTAAPDYGYTFTGWADSCTGTGGCPLDMSADKAVTATFIETPIASCSANPAKVNGIFYPSIQAAYNAAPDNSTIKLLATDLYESFTANRPIAVTIDGGYKCSFTSSSTETVIHGSPQITDGAVIMMNINVNQ